MDQTEVSHDDSVARCVSYSQHFSPDPIAVDSVKLFDIRRSNDHPNSYEGSLVSRALAVTDDRIHEIGCSIAALQNSGTPPPKQRRYYTGFREAPAANLKVSNDQYQIELWHKEENGNREHVALLIHPKGDRDSERKNQRTEACRFIARQFGGTLPHICAVDLNDDQHPLKRDPDCLQR